jgi:hypothetical protein
LRKSVAIIATLAARGDAGSHDVLVEYTDLLRSYLDSYRSRAQDANAAGELAFQGGMSMLSSWSINAAKALAEHGDAHSYDVLVQAAQAPEIDGITRGDVARFLVQHNDPRTPDVLFAQAAEPDPAPVSGIFLGGVRSR